MTKFWRRMVFLAWVVGGPLPLTYLWRIIRGAMAQAGAEDGFASLIGLYVVGACFAVVAFSIFEIKVSDK